MFAKFKLDSDKNVKSLNEKVKHLTLTVEKQNLLIKNLQQRTEPRNVSV